MAFGIDWLQGWLAACVCVLDLKLHPETQLTCTTTLLLQGFLHGGSQ